MQPWINCLKQDVLFSPDSSDPSHCIGSSAQKFEFLIQSKIHSDIS